MAKYTPDTISSGFNTNSKINENFNDVATELNDKVLYRNNPTGEPNQMENNLDMNSKRIQNLPAPVNDNEPARWADVKDGVSTVDEPIPSQTGNTKKFLSTNGSSLVFKDVLSDESLYTATGTGAVARTVQSKLDDVVSVADFGTVGDGIANDTTAIQSAVTYANTNSKELFWPAGTYLTTSSITNFHNVRHKGVGIVKRGTDLFYITPKDFTEENHIYVATSGSATNDGLSSSEPINTLQGAIDVLELWGPYLPGTWQIDLAAGTYARGRFPDEGLASANPIKVVGPDVSGHPNVPTALIKEGATEAAVGIRATRNTNILVKDVKFEDYNGSTSSAGISVSNRCNVFTENAHFEDCFIGISGNEWCEIDVKGGIFNDCGFENSTTSGGYGIRGLFHAKFSIGTQGAGDLTQGPVFTNNWRGVFGQEHADGHVDWCTFSDNNVGVRLAVASRANLDGSDFQREGTAVWATDNSIISPSANTSFGTGANANTRNILATGSSTVTSNIFDSGGTANSGSENCLFRRAGVPLSTINTTSATVIHDLVLLGQIFRETPATANPAKAIRYKVYGSLSGTANNKRVQVRLGGNSPVGAVFTASESGVFFMEGTLLLGDPDEQVVHIVASRHQGTGNRQDLATFTEALTSDTSFKLEALVDDAADTITINGYELYTSGV